MHCFELEMKLAEHWFTIRDFFVTRGFVEHEDSFFLEKWLCPEENRWQICRCTRNHEIKSLAISFQLDHILGSSVHCADSFKSEFLDERLTRSDLLADRIQQSYIEFWCEYLERYPWESPARSDIEHFPAKFHEFQKLRRVDKVLHDHSCLVADC